MRRVAHGDVVDRETCSLEPSDSFPTGLGSQRNSMLSHHPPPPTLALCHLFVYRLTITHGSIPPLVLAAYGGCFLVKRCAKLAFSKHKRSMLAGDMLTEIPTVFQTVLEPEDTQQM